MNPEPDAAKKAGPPGAWPPFRIGPLVFDPPAVMAPMAGLTSWPVRMICREMGASLAFTEMISAVAVARGRVQADTLNALKTRPGDRPLGIQIFGSTAGEMAEAARSLAYMEADLVDINMGCPVRKIIRSGSGCALMLDPYRAGKIVRAAKQALSVPLTVKMRTGWDESSKNAVELARVCESEGADAITIHGRTKAQGFSGETDLDTIQDVVSSVNIPVIGNGGIMCARDAENMIEKTGCAAVMVARGAIGNPWIFAAIAYGENSPKANPPLEEKARLILQHLDWIKESVPERKLTSEMRKHMAWYVKGMPDAAAFRRELHQLNDFHEVKDLVQRFFQSEPEPSCLKDG
ncbi:MAG: tRNA dihydrouridine synthase DusB [bacterium]